MRRRTIIGKSKSGGVPGGFKMQIQTTTANQVFTLPTRSEYNYNATVLWGDGTQSSVTGHNVNNAKTYAVAGTYNIEIQGQFDSIYFNNTGSKSAVRKILSWGGSDFQGFITMNGAFSGCNNLNELADGGVKERTPITTFSSTFASCTSLPSIPADLFKYNTAVTTFSSTFDSCSSLLSVPTDLFKYNILVTTFSSTFYYCPSLPSIPADLFKYNTAVTDFSYTFRFCNKLQLRSDIFGIAGFGTRIMDFSYCFDRTTFTGTQGTAPTLWSMAMNASSTKTMCFAGAGNSTTSISNYASIPAAWK